MPASDSSSDVAASPTLSMVGIEFGSPGSAATRLRITPVVQLYAIELEYVSLPASACPE